MADINERGKEVRREQALEHLQRPAKTYALIKHGNGPANHKHSRTCVLQSKIGPSKMHAQVWKMGTKVSQLLCSGLRHAPCCMHHAPYRRKKTTHGKKRTSVLRTDAFRPRCAVDERHTANYVISPKHR